MDTLLHTGKHLRGAHRHVVHDHITVIQFGVAQQQVGHQIDDVPAGEVRSGLLAKGLGKALDEILKYIATVHGADLIRTEVAFGGVELLDDQIQAVALHHTADDVVKNHIKYQDKITKFYCIQTIGVQLLGFMFVLPLYLGWLVMVKKSVSAGDFVAVFNGAYSIATSVNFLTVWAISRFEERGKMIEKYRGFLNADKKIFDGETESECAAPEEIKIENLSFTYPGNSSPTLDNISLTIKPYEKIALVGFNGAGKTTLTNLLLRLYDVSDGLIKIGGRDIRSSTVESHKNRFSAVFQDFQTFALAPSAKMSL